MYDTSTPSYDSELLALEPKDIIDKDPRIVSLLKDYVELFAEPTGLPPSRGIYDHNIVLQSRIEPINKIPIDILMLRRTSLKKFCNKC